MIIQFRSGTFSSACTLKLAHHILTTTSALLVSATDAQSSVRLSTDEVESAGIPPIQNTYTQDTL